MERLFGPLALVALAHVGCVELPPLPVDRTTPAIAASAPPAGYGQVVVDAEGTSRARLDEVVGHAKIRSNESIVSVIGGTWVVLPYSTTKDLAITRERCAALPCVVNAPIGRAELAVRSPNQTQSFRLDVGAERTYVRVRLPEEHRPTVGVLGWVLAGIALTPMAAGASMLAADSSELLAPGLVSVGGGLALAAIGLVLALTHPITSRPGTLAAWTVP